MVARLLELLPAFLSTRGRFWRIAVELTVGGGIADIVVAVSNRPLVDLSRPLSVRESVVLALLRQEGPISFDALAARCRIARKRLEEIHIKQLGALNLVRVRNGIVRATNVAKSVRLLAIEAKLTEWTTAIGQAVGYTRYADESYVAMPLEAAPAAAWKARFVAEQVGLLGVRTDDVRQCVRSRRFASHDWRREYALTRVLAKGKGSWGGNVVSAEPA